MAVDLSDLRPALDELGAIMRARTRDQHGNELGTFTDETRPTADEVDLALDQALALVAPRLGQVSESLLGMARALVALRAAVLVETSYVPEEADTSEGSAYASYREQYRDALADYDATAGKDVGPTRTRVASVGMSFLALPQNQP